MWLAYVQFQRILRLLGPSMPVSYDSNLQQFTETKKKVKNLWTYYATNFSVFLVWAVVNVRLGAFMKQQSTTNSAEIMIKDSKESPLDFTTFTLDLLYWSLCLQALSTAWTFHTKSHCACWLLNQMSLKRRTYGKSFFKVAFKRMVSYVSLSFHILA